MQHTDTTGTDHCQFGVTFIEGGDTQVGIWDIRGKQSWDMGDCG